MNDKTGLLLEGGAMRSVFSAGVIDFLLDKGIKIPNVLAVSAGAYAGMNYVSGQKGRIISALVEPLGEYRYVGLGPLLKKGTVFDMDYLFDVVPVEKSPFDYEAMLNYPGRFVTSTIDMNTGELIYHEKFRDLKHFFRVCRAANSLPITAKICYVDGVPMLDGGIADAIPVERAIAEGWDKILAVLTRDSVYRKKEGLTAYVRAIHLIYRKFPNFLKVVDERAAKYNRAIETLEQMEKEGRALVIRPTDITLKNKESRVDELKKYYKHGYDEAARRIEEIVKFLEL